MPANVPTDPTSNNGHIKPYRAGESFDVSCKVSGGQVGAGASRSPGFGRPTAWAPVEAGNTIMEGRSLYPAIRFNSGTSQRI